jgi:hypothetical protein
MGSIPPGGWGTGPRRDRWGQPFDDPMAHSLQVHYGPWLGVIVSSLLASFLLARRQGKSFGGVLLRGLILTAVIFVLVMLIGHIAGSLANPFPRRGSGREEQQPSSPTDVVQPALPDVAGQ